MSDLLHNLTHTVKINEVGKIINFLLEDANGPIDLTSYTVTMTLKKGSVVAVTAIPVDKQNQTTNKGECFHTWNANSIPDISGSYKGELKAVQGIDTLYFPVNADGSQTYFRVIVQDALG